MKRVTTLFMGAAAFVALTPATSAFAQSGKSVAEADAAPADPVRTAAAEKAARAIVPDGTMMHMADVAAEMMNGQIKDSIFASMDGISMGDAVAPYGVKIGKAEQATLKKVPMREFMLALDPYFEQRMALMLTAITERMKPIYVQMEPGIRSGIAQSLAKEYSTEELAELSIFVTTPAGKRFAGDILLLFMKPEVMGEMQKLTPEIMKQMPEIMSDVEKSMQQFPDSKADPEATRKRIGALLEKYRDQ